MTDDALTSSHPLPGTTPDEMFPLLTPAQQSRVLAHGKLRKAEEGETVAESALVLRNGAAIGLATIEASEEGIFRILLMMRPSKLVAISRSAEAKRESLSGFQTPAH